MLIEISWNTPDQIKMVKFNKYMDLGTRIYNHNQAVSRLTPYFTLIDYARKTKAYHDRLVSLASTFEAERGKLRNRISGIDKTEIERRTQIRASRADVAFVRNNMNYLLHFISMDFTHQGYLIVDSGDVVKLWVEQIEIMMDMMIWITVDNNATAQELLRDWKRRYELSVVKLKSRVRLLSVDFDLPRAQELLDNLDKLDRLILLNFKL